MHLSTNRLHFEYVIVANIHHRPLLSILIYKYLFHQNSDIRNVLCMNIFGTHHGARLVGPDIMTI
jgi:hypothetical protein